MRSVIVNDLTDDIAARVLRIRDAEKFGGGLMSNFVGALTLDFGVVLKQGDASLVRQGQFMRDANATRDGAKRLFPEILAMGALRNEGGGEFLLMEDLRRFVSVHEFALATATSSELAYKAVDRCFEALDAVHALPTSKATPTAKPGFIVERLTQRLAEVSNAVGAELSTSAVAVDGATLPSIDSQLERLLSLDDQAIRASCHGDAHLRNMMVRRNGPRGLIVVMIDPNPDIGAADPVFDFGRLLHMSRPNTLAAVRGEGAAKLATKGATLTLSAPKEEGSRANKRRAVIAERIRSNAIARVQARGCDGDHGRSEVGARRDGRARLNRSSARSWRSPSGREERSGGLLSRLCEGTLVTDTEDHPMKSSPLAKSTVVAFKQCPKRAWLEVHRASERPPPSSLRRMLEGNAVGELARTL